MGGLGSGNWYRWQGKKATVEESLTVATRDFRGRIFGGAAGTLTWTWASGDKSSVGYFVTWGDAPILTLHYRWRDSEDVRIPVHPQTTPTQFGGQRWWFTCPLIVNGVACHRRAGTRHRNTQRGLCKWTRVEGQRTRQAARPRGEAKSPFRIILPKVARIIRREKLLAAFCGKTALSAANRSE